mmetsp:Transcript_8321/g.32809  ORF Transcript_8321/g.32809 Transcript_8321/m.32809 type:complete len:233 (-) Transcript_8321:529-1227(-)
MGSSAEKCDDRCFRNIVFRSLLQRWKVLAAAAEASPAGFHPGAALRSPAVRGGPGWRRPQARAGPRRSAGHSNPGHPRRCCSARSAGSWRSSWRRGAPCCSTRWQARRRQAPRRSRKTAGVRARARSLAAGKLEPTRHSRQCLPCVSTCLPLRRSGRLRGRALPGRSALRCRRRPRPGPRTEGSWPSPSRARRIRRARQNLRPQRSPPLARAPRAACKRRRRRACPSLRLRR